MAGGGRRNPLMSDPRKSIFVTGAASGMGRETAKLFSGKGWYVGAFDVDEKGLRGLAAEFGTENCLARRLDVTDKRAYDGAVAEFGAATGGRLDLLFNNAGIGETGWFEDVPYERTLRLVQINYIGVLNGVYAALPLLKATPNSLCFTTSSSSATYGMPRLAVYASTKFAIKGLTEALSIEFERHGVRCADVLPGLIDTAILRNTVDHSSDTRSTDSAIEKMAPKSGMFRLIPPSAVAECVWQAYHGNRLHWYVPPEIVWIDRLKGLFPQLVRGRVRKEVLANLAKLQGRE